MNNRIAIFIIAYNAESHIRQTLARIPGAIWEQIEEAYIVDDCSLDETVKLALELKKDYPKLRVIRNRTNRRYGGNQKVGFQYALDQGYDVVVMLHADGQYAPEILPAMVEPLLNDRAEIVLGSRMIRREDALRGGMPKYKYYGNIILTDIQNWLSGMTLKEFHTGYRAYRTSFLRQVHFWDNTDEWHFDTEILFQGCSSGARIVEVPIPTYYGDEICHVNGMAYGMNCILTTIRYALYKRGIYYCRSFDVHASENKYSSKFSDPYSSHSLIYKYLHEKSLLQGKVLELGVGDASLTKRMSAAGAEIDCVEIDRGAATVAQGYARRVWVANLDSGAFEQIDEVYDTVVAADVLEHLLRPEEILSRLKRCVRKGGLLIVSLPNVANIYVRLNIMFGRFPYHTKGILDSSHLHFYTLKTSDQLLRKTGWEVIGRDYTNIPFVSVFPFLQRPGFGFVLKIVRGLTRIFKGLCSYQIILFCKNPNEGDLL